MVLCWRLSLHNKMLPIVGCIASIWSLSIIHASASVTPPERNGVLHAYQWSTFGVSNEAGRRAGRICYITVGLQTGPEPSLVYNKSSSPEPPSLFHCLNRDQGFSLLSLSKCSSIISKRVNIKAFDSTTWSQHELKRVLPAPNILQPNPSVLQPVPSRTNTDKQVQQKH